MDGVIALSPIQGSDYTDYAALVRFSTTGTIDARNGGSYSSDASIPYVQGQQFRFRLAIDIPGKEYSVYVTPQGQSEIALASGYAFRTEQAAAAQLGWLGMISVTGSCGVCDHIIADLHRADASPPFGCMSMGELNAFIILWKADSTATPMREMMGAVGLWKAGTGC
jgi:hypothetical protein